MTTGVTGFSESTAPLTTAIFERMGDRWESLRAEERTGVEQLASAVNVLQQQVNDLLSLSARLEMEIGVLQGRLERTEDGTFTPKGES